MTQTGDTRRPREVAEPPVESGAWERYWSAIGSRDIPPWDTDPEGQLSDWCRQVSGLLRPGLPLMDVACGNGHQTSWLAQRFATSVGPVIGVDVSATAVALAREQQLHLSGVDYPGVRFEVVDVLDDQAVKALAARTGPANVWVRFLLHLLDDDDARRRAIASLATLAGGQGRIFDYEFLAQEPGKMEGYAARHTSVRAVFEAGVRPGQLMPRELAALYRDAGLTVLTERSDEFHGAHGPAEGTFHAEWIVAGGERDAAAV
ncbi:hypothetical protein C9F11_46875 (plasmid) [Streptomyces sp. YIM 121038]|uniref:class I SAM-dependent methyltransferase n=1 Tax=Streptomyces sp. YIM 121038 TaxID=2136401 RepID=UPI0011655A4D|nr:class I SAM-dependent methyltransferase [Streptomyces sp. YIM 121038]QCX82922.1 hypothetical protein C9F11_46875 [Streptomyces sp. YIM 121038]